MDSVECSLNSLRRRLQQKINEIDGRALWTPGQSIGRYQSMPGPKEEIDEERDKREAIVLNSYPENLVGMLINCYGLPERQKGDPELKHLLFCLDMTVEAMRTSIFSEPMFVLLRKPKERKEPRYSDHIFHVMNVYLLGSDLLQQSSTADPQVDGSELLIDMLRDSRHGKACAELLGHPLGAHRSEDKMLMEKAWQMASYCHDIGYVLSLTADMKGGRPEALTQGDRKFENSLCTLCEAFEKGLKSFINSCIDRRKSEHVEAVLTDLYDKLTAGNPYQEIDHGKASAVLVMNRFTEAVKDTTHKGLAKEKQDIAALFLAICAIFSHTELTEGIEEGEYEHRDDGIHKPETWRKKALAAFLATVDLLLDSVARLCWHIGDPPRNEAEIPIPLRGFFPVQGMELTDNGVTYHDVNPPIGEAWNPSTTPSKFARDYLTRALKDCFGVVGPQFTIGPYQPS